MTSDIDISLWQPAALSQDLPPATVIPTRCGAHEIALWRSASGRIAAWQDRCPHRGMRLSHGFVRGEMLSCIYHGWRYDGSGTCRKIPAHPGLEPPTSIAVPTFSVAERDGVVWIAADPSAPEPPALPGDLHPLRSLPVERPAGDLGEGWPVALGEGLFALIQPIDAGTSMVHALVSPDTDARAASRRLEQLRRTFEAEAAA
ncbi:Rieske (2Fe-2S) protein [Palleronia sp. LCG004]|uniref:Rieske (2Fe-2S) protein n=1 Tax=Palleronia sp. LCG004 TaxID=3079304 RepID=UPI002943AF3F|nr:Rieske (2Fe-2S) protein [Palleronia sp. LCG004]WOI56443.1 Rieske (2Fe-2S) protein [Palleronia sp. LCG004]